MPIKMSSLLDTKNAQMTFAGVTFKTTKTGRVPRRYLLEILRSGRVRVGQDPAAMASLAQDPEGMSAADSDFLDSEMSAEALDRLTEEVEECPTNWWCDLGFRQDGSLRLRSKGTAAWNGYQITEKS